MTSPRHTGYPYDASIARSRQAARLNRRARRRADGRPDHWLTWLLR